MSLSMTEKRRSDAPSPASPEDAGWEAVRRRDPAFDGKLSSPSAPPESIAARAAPRARRGARTSSFFPTADAAEKAGYRACKRCRPDRLGAPDPKVQAVRRACAEIEQAEEAPRLADLAASAGLSPYHFHRVFKAITGVTPKAYGAQTRARRAATICARARRSPRPSTIPGTIPRAGSTRAPPPGSA